MFGERAVFRPDDPLTGRHTRASYNAAERRFSHVLQQRLQDVLEAKSNRLDLLRRYAHEPDRIGVMVTPAGISSDQLRLAVVEDLVWRVINFVRSDHGSGPVSQSMTADGGIVEVQTFPTKFPHIVIERVDRYHDQDLDPSDTSWSLRRVQNQRFQTQINRAFDAVSIVLDIVRVLH